MTNIALQYDAGDTVLLDQVQEHQNVDKANNEENLQVKFDLEYMEKMNPDWLLKSRKKLTKPFLSSLTKADHLRFARQIGKSFNFEGLEKGV